METRKIKLYEITYKNNTGAYYGTLAYGVNLIEIIREYQKELEKTNDSSLIFNVRETEYEYIYKNHPNDVVYYFYDEDPDEKKYDNLLEPIEKNNFQEGFIKIYIYDSLEKKEDILDYYYDFNSKLVINKRTLNMITISSEGIKFFITEQENGMTRKLI